MKITSLSFHPVVVERKYGTVIAQEGGKAKRTVTKSYCYFVELETDTGLTGWGEISDVELEDLPEDVGEYAELLRKFTVGRRPYELQRLHHDMREHFDLEGDSLAHYTACALDMAMYDLIGKAHDRPVYDLLGGAVRKDVRISWVAYIRENLDLLRDEIRQRRAEGFNAYKLKVGLDIGLDEERMAVLRETAGREASIKIDANAGWSRKDAPANIKRLARYGLAGVETPVPREDPADIAAVRRQVEVPILEHVSTLQYALGLVKHDAVDAFNIATTGAGGLWPARQIVAVSQAAGVGVLLGSTVEMGPGTHAQLHLAATVPNLTLPSDLIGPGMYQDDVLARPITYRQGQLLVPEGAGLGLEIDRNKLARLVG